MVPVSFILLSSLLNESAPGHLWQSSQITSAHPNLGLMSAVEWGALCSACVRVFASPSVLILRAVLTRANSVALNITVPSLFSGMFIDTRRCGAQEVFFSVLFHCSDHYTTKEDEGDKQRKAYSKKNISIIITFHCRSKVVL